MKKSVVASLLIAVHLSALACQPIGWRLVHQKLISLGERLCVYEKNDVRVQIIVSGFCPLNPC